MNYPTFTSGGSRIPGLEERSSLARQYAYYLESFFWLAKKYRTVAAVAEALAASQEIDNELDATHDLYLAEDETFDLESHNGRAMRELSRSYVFDLCDSGATHAEMIAILHSEIAARAFSTEWTRVLYRRDTQWA